MIRNAATVIIIRKKYTEDNNYTLEVLLGQNEVKNCLKSDTDNIIMRYPGEYKYPGGVCDDSGNKILLVYIYSFIKLFN
jgi:hypothetical protein